MAHADRPSRRLAVSLIWALGIGVAAWVLSVGVSAPRDWRGDAHRNEAGTNLGKTPLGLPQELVDGAMCPLTLASSSQTLLATLQQQGASDRTGSAAEENMQRPITVDRPPLRVVRDPFPTFAAVVLDKKNDEIILQDENLFQIMFFDRTTNTPPSASFSEPKRVIGGAHTEMEFNCALYVDPTTGDVYSVNNDTLDTMTVWSRTQRGDMPASRQLETPHGSYGIAVDEAAQEMFMTVQHASSVVVYNKFAKGNDKPIRMIAGNKTGIGDPHGIGLDTKNGWIFVANYGSTSLYEAGQERNGGGGTGGQGRINGSGKFYPPSITIYPIKSDGDVAPLRTITGPKTQLNWPAHMYVDEEHGELYVANDGSDAILVFKITDGGDVAPTRVLSGPKTEIKNPTGIVVDNAHEEIVVANMGNHRATVYNRTASGDTAPIRRIRAGPEGIPALQIGNPGAVAYDSKRDEILVPNCVAHPQIAAFDRFAKGGDAPHRMIFGQPTKLSRTMHDIRYNEKRDEIYVTNPFAQAIIVFKGDADRQAAPVRIIQGPKTMLGAEDTLEVDSVNDEILIPAGDQILVYSAGANGDVAPIRRPHRASPNPGWNIGGGIAVDPVHNVIATDGSLSGEMAKKLPYSPPGGGNGAGGRNTILIWDRLADGVAMPLRAIRGDKTGIQAIRQMQIYPKGGWIVISQITDGGIPEPAGTFVGVWSIYDNGNVPPMWKIPGTAGAMVMKKPRGVTLDPKHKEVIVSDMRLNAVLTFSLPEMFDQVAKPQP